MHSDYIKEQAEKQARRAQQEEVRQLWSCVKGVLRDVRACVIMLSRETFFASSATLLRCSV